ncbi:MAG: HD domain-containing protein [Gemmatimonadales bacterium]|nr:MAG: HD domain-containing protein [Gemmatimonadales bacterium]
MGNDPSRSRIVRDPLWNTIRLDPVAVRIVDTGAFQRLRYIRQLGFAHLVYPGATHTRFDHALGVYHLASTALSNLESRGELEQVRSARVDLVPYAALLHDIGHYAFSHALEELEGDQLPGDHEAMSLRFFRSPELASALDGLGPGAPEEIHDMIRGDSSHPLRGLVSGGLDLDKMEYLRRDARFCGVPYGEVDVDRLIQGLVLLEDPGGRGLEVGIEEKALSALESLLFAKYQMFRNVYWHHAVRSATALYKRIVDEAVRSGLLGAEDLVGPTDEALLLEIRRRGESAPGEVARRISREWLPALRERRLPKRACELTGSDLAGVRVPAWLGHDSPGRRQVEERLALREGLEPREVFVDWPTKARMLDPDVPVRRRDGRVERLGEGGIPGVMDLLRVAGDLYRSSRVLRVFTVVRCTIRPEAVLGIVAEVEADGVGAAGPDAR